MEFQAFKAARCLTGPIVLGAGTFLVIVLNISPPQYVLMSRSQNRACKRLGNVVCERGTKTILESSRECSAVH